MTITEFLLARIAEDEAVARLASSDPGVTAALAQDEWGFLWIKPERVLAECEAKRELVESLGAKPTPGTSGYTDYLIGVWAGTHSALLHLADAYADHPDHESQWD